MLFVTTVAIDEHMTSTARMMNMRLYAFIALNVWRDLLFRLTNRTGMVEMLHQFRTIKHGVLEFVVEIERIVRTVDHAKHAIHALSVVVNVVGEDLFLATVLVFHHLCFDDDRIVGTYILTHAATYTLMLVEFVVRQNELTAKTLEHFCALCGFRDSVP